MILSLAALILGFLLDLRFGDPHWMPHPIRLIGWLISSAEKAVRKRFPKTNGGELAAGVMLVVIVLLLTLAGSGLLLVLAYLVSPWLFFALETLMCYQILATKSLKTESMKVYDELKAGDLEGARKMVSMIVGRDTQNLTYEQVAKATVETVAENTSDGIVAPLFFLMLGGAPLGFLYKAINTMDSMIGYKNDKYLYLGRCAAKLDDIANFLPARISAWLMIFGAKLIGMDSKNARRVFLRDRFHHASPNSAQTEAVCAGALGVQLAGDAYYFGHLHHKETIGDADRPVEYEDIQRANRLLYATASLMVVCVAIVRIAVIMLW